MRSLIIISLFLASVANAKPRQCNPEKSKPCGNSCIKKEFKCHKTTTTSIIKK